MTPTLHKFFLVLSFLAYVFVAQTAHAQSTATSTIGISSIASTYEVSGGNVQSGDLVAVDSESGTFILSRRAYDDNTFGVVVLNPAVVFRGPPPEVPVVQSGRTSVNVSNINGAINTGDPVTTSPIAGVGQRAEYGMGTIVGFALEPFSSDNSTEDISFDGEVYSVGQIAVSVNIRSYETVQDREVQNVTGGQGESSFVDILRFVIAGAVALLSIYISFNTFGNNVSKGVESIGRNPLARRSIQVTVAFNVLLIVVVSGLGLFVAALIALYPF